ncbi:MAG: hypothetical protein M5U25_13380 [Planctomycetota bacterium]|nr:hypothetical protein [Planctomycetota bacterium]
MNWKRLEGSNPVGNLSNCLDDMAAKAQWSKTERDDLIQWAKGQVRRFTDNDPSVVADIQINFLDGTRVHLRVNIPKVTGHHCFADAEYKRSDGKPLAPSPE